MEINQIRYVYYVAKYRNFSLAAEHLFVTQPTLSQQVRRLEDELGFRLFKRSTRTVTLTSEGEAFVKRAKPLLKMYDDLADEMAALKKENRHTEFPRTERGHIAHMRGSPQRRADWAADNEKI